MSKVLYFEYCVVLQWCDFLLHMICISMRGIVWLAYADVATRKEIRSHLALIAVFEKNEKSDIFFCMEG